MVDFFETNLFKKELAYKDIGANQKNSSSVTSTLISEPFGLAGVAALGLPYYNIPTGWTKSHISVTGFDDNATIPTCTIPSTSGGVLLTWGNSNVGNTYLTTKAVSTVGKAIVKLSFNEYRGITATSPYLFVEYSPNNGTTWFSSGWTDTTPDLTWTAYTNIVLPIGAGNVPQLKVRFGILADASGEAVSIDDVLITAT